MQIAITFSSKGTRVLRSLFEKGRSRIDVSDPRHATLTGLHVGDSEERAKQVYAGRYEIEPHAYVDEGHYLIVRSRDKRYALVIETDGRVVTRLRAGSMPAAEFVEGCS